MAEKPKMPAPLPTPTPKAETPPEQSASDTATPTPSSDLTPEELADIAAKRQAGLKAEQDKNIADLRLKIAEADKRLAKYQGDDVDTVEFREYTQKTKPEAWKAINELPALLRSELSDYMLSILSPEQKQAKIDWDKVSADLEAAQKAQSDLRAQIISKFPDFFGVEKAAKAPRAPKADSEAKAAPASSKPWVGEILDNTNGQITARVKALHESGVTSERDIIKSIYPGDYDVSNSKPRFQIHPIRLKLGYVPPKS